MKTGQALKDRSVLMILAPKGFQDDEFGKPYELLDQLGATITIASTRKGAIHGVMGKTAVAHGAIENYAAKDFDALLFIGGPGSDIFFHNTAAHRLAQTAMTEERVKVLAAICIAPVTLGNAGVLQGKHATSYPDVQGLLVARGAILESNLPVVQDGKIITAAGPYAASEFAHKVVSALLG
jgi:protease I